MFEDESLFDDASTKAGMVRNERDDAKAKKTK